MSERRFFMFKLGCDLRAGQYAAPDLVDRYELRIAAEFEAGARCSQACIDNIACELGLPLVYQFDTQDRIYEAIRAALA